jgi:hypothetical protein
MEVEYRIKKYTEIFNRVREGYRGLKKFIVEDQCISKKKKANQSLYTSWWRLGGEV